MVDAIYARQSIDKKDSVSIDAQIEKCKTVLQDSSVEVYFDKGWSGKSTDRPMMNKLISDIKSNKIRTIVVYRIDRISRNIVDFANLLTLFDKHNVNFISATEQFDTSSAMGRAMIYIVMVFAQLERETIAARIKDNYKFRCSTGKYFMGGNVPYGYKTEKTIIDGKKGTILLEDEETSNILKMIFNDFVNGDSTLKIANKLNSLNITTNKGNTWSAKSITRILNNITPVKADKKIFEYLTSMGYIITNSEEDFDGSHGTLIFFKNKNKNEETEISDRIVVIGMHEPIIDSETYIKANSIIKSSQKTNTTKSSKASFLAGMIKCKECGHSFGLKTTSRNGKQYGYYYCRGRSSHGVSTCNNSLWIEKNKLENEVVRRMKKHVNVKYSEKQKEMIESENNSIEESQIQTQIDNLIMNIGKGNSTVDELLTNKITELQNRLMILKNVSDVRSDFSSGLEILSKMIGKFDEYDIYKKTDITRKIIDKIIVGSDEKVTIKYLI